jgi:putative glutamine transport system permease protein
MELFDPGRWAQTLSNSDLLWQGFFFTIQVSLAGLLVSLVMGTLLGVFSTTRSRVLRGIARVYVEFFQNTPIVVQVFFVYTAGPMVLQAITGAAHVVRIAPFVLVVICVGLYHGAYVAEVIRTGIEAIPRGQMEATQSQGFTRVQAYRYVILPQTFRIILPPLANQALNLVKNTSVLALIAGGDLMYQADIIVADSGYLQGYIVCCAMYFLICFPLAMLVTWLEKRSKAPRKAKATHAVPAATADGEV